MVLKFDNVQGSWFVDLPKYIEEGGDYADLQMVAGADVMLDEMTSGMLESVSVIVSEKQFEGYEIRLEGVMPGEGGYVYKVFPTAHESIGRNYPEHVWLCAVTSYVFKGRFPETLYLRRLS